MRSVKDEIRQTRPFASPAGEAVVTLLRTADVLRRRLSEVVEPHGITVQQYNVLRILRGAGSEGLATLDVAARMIETTPGITRLLERLEKKRLVRRRRSPEDRRRVLCFATPAASRLLATVDGPMLDAGNTFLGPLGANHTRELIVLLNAARHSATTAPESPIRRPC
jgi:DNA-binding MarR family transcriptional regulator